MSFTESIWGEYEVTKQVRPQIGNANVLVAPYDAFHAQDGWVFIGAATSSAWKALCKITGREELIDDPRFQTMEGRIQPESRQFFAEWLGVNGWLKRQLVSWCVN